MTPRYCHICCKLGIKKESGLTARNNMMKKCKDTGEFKAKLGLLAALKEAKRTRILKRVLLFSNIRLFYNNIEFR